MLGYVILYYVILCYVLLCNLEPKARKRLRRPQLQTHGPKPRSQVHFDSVVQPLMDPRFVWVASLMCFRSVTGFHGDKDYYYYYYYYSYSYSYYYYYYYSRPEAPKRVVVFSARSFSVSARPSFPGARTAIEWTNRTSP